MVSVRTRKPPVEGGTRVGASMQPSGVRHDVTRTTKAKAAITKQTLGQCIAEKRCGCGMPQEALAEQLNVTPQTMGKWENDASSPNVMRLIDGGRGGSAVAGGHPERNAYGAVGGLIYGI